MTQQPTPASCTALLLSTVRHWLCKSAGDCSSAVCKICSSCAGGSHLPVAAKQSAETTGPGKLISHLQQMQHALSCSTFDLQHDRSKRQLCRVQCRASAAVPTTSDCYVNIWQQSAVMQRACGSLHLSVGPLEPIVCPGQSWGGFASIAALFWQLSGNF